MVNKLSILDLWDIKEFVDKWEEAPLLFRMHKLLSDGVSCVLTNEDFSIVYILEAKSKLIALQHVYSNKEVRGKRMISWLKEVQEWVKLNTGFKYVFHYTDDKRLKVLMPIFGSEKIGVYRGRTVYRTEV